MRIQKWIANAVCGVLTGAALLSGCSKKPDEVYVQADSESESDILQTETMTEAVFWDEGQEETEFKQSERDVQWSEYFDGLNGSAVIYDASAGEYMIYNRELAAIQRSPCSTFKIISSLIALEHGILDPDHSIRTWSGETFWNESWNRDIDFYEAFRASCVWYFRELADEIGQDKMQQELNKLSYGNCDISDWEGRLNTNNNNRALTGFWLESSLAISPKEQAEVMERIFGTGSIYSKKTQDQLKQVMQETEDYGTNVAIYGKTGMGKAQGEVVDAWYTGYAEAEGRSVSFCIYLGQTDGKDVSSTKAREIAVRILLQEMEW